MNRPELDRNYNNGKSEKASSGRVVIFTIYVGDEIFGLPIDCVKTVFHSTAITSVPLAPNRMLGLINLRGHVVTAICLNKSLGLNTNPSRETLMVAVDHNGEGFALSVGKVGDVIEVSDGDRIPIPATISALRRRMTSAVYKTPGGIIPVLNIAALLDTDSELAA